MGGYCCLVLKRHAVELYELGADEAYALMSDLQRAAKAIQDITGAVKMNYEIHGNTLPHLHVHLFPRYKGDPFEEGPIDTRLIRESPFGEGEFESFKCSLQVRLSEGLTIRWSGMLARLASLSIEALEGSERKCLWQRNWQSLLRYLCSQ